ncbi:hypothetical protein NL676_017376 [Syzygium grande]|nr:hypothetical protein NL676_017376 [Syzygium grande]
MTSARTSFYLNPAGRGSNKVKSFGWVFGGKGKVRVSAKAETEAEFCWRLWILHLQRSPALDLKPNLTTRIGSAVCRNKFLNLHFIFHTLKDYGLVNCLN